MTNLEIMSNSWIINSDTVSVMYPSALNSEIKTEVTNGYIPEIIDEIETIKKEAKSQNAFEVIKSSEESLRNLFSLKERVNQSLSENNLKTFIPSIWGEGLRVVTEVYQFKKVTEMDSGVDKLFNAVRTDVFEKPDINLQLHLQSATGTKQKRVKDFFEDYRKALIKPALRPAYKQLDEKNSSDIDVLADILEKETKEKYEEIVDWQNIFVSPNRDDLKQIKMKWICLKYKEDRAGQIFRWIKETVDYARAERIMLPILAVLVDYMKMKPVESLRLSKRLDEAGATFVNFPKGCDSYEQSMNQINKNLHSRVTAGMYTQQGNDSEVKAA